MQKYYLLFPPKLVRSRVPELTGAFITITAPTRQEAETTATAVFKDHWSEVVDQRPDVDRTPYGEWSHMDEVESLRIRGTFSIRPELR